VTPTTTPVALAALTTLQVGGEPRRCVSATTEADLVAAVTAADDAGEPVLLVGGGSNLLVGDGPLDAVVVHVRTRGREVVSADACGGTFLRVAAGEGWDEVVADAVARELVGLEALSGIPGSTGATPVQNVGAYGQEVSDTIATVRTWDRRDRRVRTLAGPDCGFGYRTSRFKTVDAGRFLILSVTFQLARSTRSAPVRYRELATRLGVQVGDRAPLADVRDAVLALRAGKGMVLDAADRDTASAGSFFTNPVLDAATAAALPPDAPRYATADGGVKTSAAWLVERAGFARGHGLPGPASLSTKHTLALTNRGGARAEDLLALAREVRGGVRAAFGVELEVEPTLVGCAL
jgi:UDP-N-acetylmuramate dehydrogenase